MTTPTPPSAAEVQSLIDEATGAANVTTYGPWWSVGPKAIDALRYLHARLLADEAAPSQPIDYSTEVMAGGGIARRLINCVQQGTMHEFRQIAIGESEELARAFIELLESRHILATPPAVAQPAPAPVEMRSDEVESLHFANLLDAQQTSDIKGAAAIIRDLVLDLRTFNEQLTGMQAQLAAKVARIAALEAENSDGRDVRQILRNDLAQRDAEIERLRESLSLASDASTKHANLANHLCEQLAAANARAEVAERERDALIEEYFKALGYVPDDKSFVHALLHIENAIGNRAADFAVAISERDALRAERDALRASSRARILDLEQQVLEAQPKAEMDMSGMGDAPVPAPLTDDQLATVLSRVTSPGVLACVDFVRREEAGRVIAAVRAQGGGA